MTKQELKILNMLAHMKVTLTDISNKCVLCNNQEFISHLADIYRQVEEKEETFKFLIAEKEKAL